ncbi:hypothetical protein JMN32_00635 [Fulvivirga sp. 29W222]|uniref:Uncharacterized protein n=1 Tax=Fulvivirga marina TaxID=2494733 RepID=A0A937FT02_9BACT|nr:hypothetical protein [Fulvivirga marina]MBL6444794.1 hypothetical protein [Fulvivirga marina]
MDIKALDNDLTSLIEKKIALSKTDYSSEDYDELEEELHDLEDDFLEKYGDYLEDAFHEVHDEFCPDTDVLLPIAYLPNEVASTEDGYDITFQEGVYVEVDDYPGKETKLVLLPKPTRIILQVDSQNKEVVWQAK